MNLTTQQYPAIAQADIEKLIHGDFSHVKAHFTELFFTEGTSYKLGSANIKHRFFYPQLTPKGKPNTDGIAKLLSASSVLFALSAKELQEIEEFYALKDPIRANAISQSAHNRFRLYAKDALTRNGEIGELLLFLILQTYFKAPKVASKMSLKTSANMHVHGADALHAYVGDHGRMILVLGESKFYASHLSALSSAIKSICEYHSNYSTQSLDASIIKNFMAHEVLDQSLQERLIEYFGTLSPKAHLIQKQIMILIGCNEPNLYKGLEDLDPDTQTTRVEDNYKVCASSVTQSVQTELGKYPEILKGDLDFGYLFFPFELIKDLRKRFLEEMGVEIEEDSLNE